jgi:protein NrfD
MNEIVITSGRMNPNIDPNLSIWGWEIPVYLFIGGLVSGILFFSTLYFIRGRKDQFPAAVKIAPLFAAPLLVLGRDFS